MALAAGTSTVTPATAATNDGGALPLNRDIRVLLAEFVDNNELLNLRLVCKELSYEVDDEFVKRFFTRREHLISRYSLGVLADITSHSRLTRKLREVEFVSAGPDQTLGCHQWERDHSDLVHEGHLAGLFWAIFNNLSQDFRSPAVSLTAFDEPAPFGVSHASRKYQCGELVAKSSHSLAWPLLCEIAKTSFGLRDLWLSSPPLFSCDGLSRAIQMCWSHLSKLSLQIDELWNPEIHGEPLSSMLAAAVGLTSLSIYRNNFCERSDFDSQCLSYFAKAVSHCPLRSLTVHDYDGSAQEYLSLLTPFNRTLEELEFERLYLSTPDRWSTVWQHVLDNFRLSSIRLVDLAEDVEDPYCNTLMFDDQPCPAIFDVSGEEAVADGLRKKCSRSEW